MIVHEVRGYPIDIKPNFVMGPNSVPVFIVKDCVSCLFKPLCGGLLSN